MPNDKNGTSEIINAQLSQININKDKNSDTSEYNFPYFIFKLFENKFAISCKYVVSIEEIKSASEIFHVHSTAASNNELIGIYYYKNEPISIFDLRDMFGLMRKSDYINDVINLPLRIKDHETYAETLENCVRSGNPFTLNIDPYECALGKWFYASKDKLDAESRSVVDYLELSHDKFHKTAGIIKKLLDENKQDETAAYLKEAEALKTEVISKLSALDKIMRANIKEINIIIQVNGRKIGLIIDEPDTVEEIIEIQNLPPSVIQTNYIKRFGLSRKERQIVLILDALAFGES